jgi:hypothetical protein
MESLYMLLFITVTLSIAFALGDYYVMWPLMSSHYAPMTVNMWTWLPPCAFEMVFFMSSYAVTRQFGTSAMRHSTESVLRDIGKCVPCYLLLESLYIAYVLNGIAVNEQLAAGLVLLHMSLSSSGAIIGIIVNDHKNLT